MIKTIIYGKKVNDIITNVEEWFNYAPPKKGKMQWKDFRSAKEHAKYMTSNLPSLPVEIENILRKYTNCNECICYGEYVTDFSSLGLGSGEGRNHDSLLVFDDLIVGIEAKADEKFDVLCGELKLDDSNKQKRYNGVSKLIFGDDVSFHPNIRYQLITASLGTLIEACKHDVKKALLLVITYNSSKLKDCNVKRNEIDLENYVNEVLKDGRIKTKYGEDNNIDFYIEKLKINL